MLFRCYKRILEGNITDEILMAHCAEMLKRGRRCTHMGCWPRSLSEVHINSCPWRRNLDRYRDWHLGFAQGSFCCPRILPPHLHRSIDTSKSFLTSVLLKASHWCEQPSSRYRQSEYETTFSAAVRHTVRTFCLPTWHMLSLELRAHHMDGICRRWKAHQAQPPSHAMHSLTKLAEVQISVRINVLSLQQRALLQEIEKWINFWSHHTIF